MERQVHTQLKLEKSKKVISRTASTGTERSRTSPTGICTRDDGMRDSTDSSFEDRNVPLVVESRKHVQKRLKRRRCWLEDTTINLEASAPPNISQIHVLPHLMSLATHATTDETEDKERSCLYKRPVRTFNRHLTDKLHEPTIRSRCIDDIQMFTESESEGFALLSVTLQSRSTIKSRIRRSTHALESCYTRSNLACGTARVVILCLLAFASTVEPTWRHKSVQQSSKFPDVRFKQHHNDSSYKMWDNFVSRFPLSRTSNTSNIRGLTSSSNTGTNSSESTNSTNVTTTSNVTVAAPSSAIHPNKGKLQIQPFCKHNYIQITSLRLLCDTPGAYYYGSNAYRKSDVCQSGDKANIEMDFIIPNRMRDRILYMKVEFGLYDRFKPINTTSLCALPVALIKAFPHVPAKIVTETLSPSTAPTTLYDDDEYTNDDIPVWGNCINASGRYHLNVSYTVPKIRDNNFHYTPDVRLTFTDIQARTVGCTVSGPYSLKVESDIRSEHGWIALGISCAILAVVFTTLLFLSFKRNEERLKNIDTNDQRRKTLLAQRRLNNLNHYQYFRTLPNGQVVPLPGLQPIGYPAQHHPFYKSPRPVLTVARRHTKPATVPLQQAPQDSNLAQHPVSIPDYLQRIPNDSSDDDDSDDDSNPIGSGEVACNPQYNEPQLPTRPVI